MSRRKQPVRPSSARARTEVVGTLFSGRLRLEKLPTTNNISARLYIQGKYVRKSTGQSTLARAKAVASEWFQDLIRRDRNGHNIHGAKFAEYAKGFLERVDARFDAGEITEGQRGNYHDKWSVLQSVIGDVSIHDIDHDWLQRLRLTRASFRNRKNQPLSNSTLKEGHAFRVRRARTCQTRGRTEGNPTLLRSQANGRSNVEGVRS